MSLPPNTNIVEPYIKTRQAGTRTSHQGKVNMLGHDEHSQHTDKYDKCVLTIIAAECPPLDIGVGSPSAIITLCHRRLGGGGGSLSNGSSSGW